MHANAIALGVYTDGFPTDPSALDRYVSLVGRPPAIVHVFRNWTDGSREFGTARVDQISRIGAVPMISWQPGWLLPAIARGEHDRHAAEYARAAAAWGERIFLRFAHEMNGAWIPWRVDGSTYRTAWHRLRRIFAAEGAGNVEWVWSPHVRDRRAGALAPYFPGRDGVEWVALDGYNWGRSRRIGRWRDFDAIFAASYRELVTLAPDRPVMLAEIGCAEEGGDKSAWMREALLDAVPTRYPAVRAVAWFHAAPRGHADWRLDSSPAALEAWREIAASPPYRSPS